MGLESIWHWVILLIIVLALFGTKKLTKIGPDLGNAVREFKKALRGDEGDDEGKEKDGGEDKDSLKADPPGEAPAAESAQQKDHHEAGQ